MMGDRGGETAFVADRSGQAFFLKDFFQGVENFRAALECGRERTGADRNDHEFLDIEIVVGVGAAVDDVHHRNRQLHDAGTAEIAVQRQTGFFGRRLGYGHGYGEHRVGAETAFVFGAVQIDQGAIQKRLFAGVQSDDRFGDFRVDVFDGFSDALAVVAAGIAVTQFDGFARTGGCT